MLQDTKELVVRKSLSDEWSLYRVTKAGQRFLLFSFGDNQNQAIERGRRIAKVLGVKFNEEGSSDSVGGKKKHTQTSKVTRRKI